MNNQSGTPKFLFGDSGPGFNLKYTHYFFNSFWGIQASNQLYSASSMFFTVNGNLGDLNLNLKYDPGNPSTPLNATWKIIEIRLFLTTTGPACQVPTASVVDFAYNSSLSTNVVNTLFN
jgi:hypothetical protein